MVKHMEQALVSGDLGGGVRDILAPTADGAVFARVRIVLGRAPAVVCLHGLGDSHLAFEEAFETRYLAGMSVIVPDMAGHGGTPAALDHSMVAAARRVRGLLVHLREHHALRPSPLYLVGHSLGGVPAIQYCREADDEVVGGLLLAEAPLTRFGSFITSHAEAARLSGRFGEWYKEFKEQVIFRDYLGRFPFCRHYYASLRFCRERSFLETATSVRRLARALPGKWSHAAGEALLGLSLPVLYAHGRDLAPETLSFLAEHDIPTRPFPTECHFLMQAMSGEFYSMLGDFCRKRSR